MTELIQIISHVDVINGVLSTRYMVTLKHMQESSWNYDPAKATSDVSNEGDIIMVEPQVLKIVAPSAPPAALRQARKKGASKRRKGEQDAEVGERRALMVACESVGRQSGRMAEATQKCTETAQTQREAMMTEFMGSLVQVLLSNNTEK